MTEVQNIRDFIAAADLENPENEGPIKDILVQGKNKILLLGTNNKVYLVTVKESPEPIEIFED